MSKLGPFFGTKNGNQKPFKNHIFLQEKNILFLFEKIKFPETKNCNFPSQINQPDPLAKANAAVRGTHQVDVNRQSFDCNALHLRGQVAAAGSARASPQNARVAESTWGSIYGRPSLWTRNGTWKWDPQRRWFSKLRLHICTRIKSDMQFVKCKPSLRDKLRWRERKIRKIWKCEKLGLSHLLGYFAGIPY